MGGRARPGERDHEAEEMIMAWAMVVEVGMGEPERLG